MHKMIIIAIGLAMVLALIAWGIRLWTYKHPPDYTEGTEAIATGTHQAVSASASVGTSADAEENTVIVDGQVFNVDVADTMEKRAQGLSGREPLLEKEGMLFIFPVAGSYGFWMKDMKFDLDIVWIKGDTVVGVTANVPAPFDSAQGKPAGGSMFTLQNYYPPAPVDKVLEISAGATAKYGINAGDKVKIKA